VKSIAGYAAAAVLGIVVGVGSAWMVLNNGELLSRFEYDHWFGNEDAGSAAAGPYTRGIIAKIGLLALNRTETIYFHRYVDDQGVGLSEECAYELSGGELPTRWWSITVYAGDDFLPMNDDQALSVDTTQIVRQTDGSWATRLASRRDDAANWISTRAAGKFNLALRMYNPVESARNDPSTITYPKIRRVSCAEGQR
jgi:hypothetical protein